MAPWAFSVHIDEDEKTWPHRAHSALYWPELEVDMGPSSEPSEVQYRRKIISGRMSTRDGWPARASHENLSSYLLKVSGFTREMLRMGNECQGDRRRVCVDGLLLFKWAQHKNIIPCNVLQERPTAKSLEQ